jgi:outer membrane protein assembly factor BamB
MNAIYNHWRLSGWLTHDIFVIAVAIVFIALCGFLLYSLIKRRSTRRLKPYLFILVIYGLIVNFIGMTFFGMFRSVTLEGKSQVFFSHKNHSFTSIERTVIPNGQSNGISTSTSMFELISVNSDTGERIWSKRMGWRNYLIGQTDRYLILNDADDDALFLLDSKTGAMRFSQADLVKKIPALSEVLSPDFPDYRFVDRRLYIHGLDNRYYQLDLENWTLTEDAKIMTIFQQHRAPAWIISASDNRVGQPISDRELTEALRSLGEQLINPVLLGKKQAHQYYVLAYKKRRGPQASIGLYDVEKQKYLWQTAVTLTEDGVPINAYQMDDALYVKAARYLFKLDTNTGRKIYQFDYRWNRVVDR